jgi:type IV secretory pathway VirB4 component
MFGLFNRKKAEPEKTLESMIDDNRGFLDIIAPDSIEEQFDYIRLGGNYARTLCVSYFTNDVQANFLQNLHNIPHNVSIVHHIEPSASDDMIKSLNRAVIEYRSRLNEPGLRPMDEIRIKNDLSDAEILLDNLTSGRAEMFNEHMYVHIQASSKKELDEVTQIVKAHVSKTMKLLIPHYRMLPAFQTILPLRQNLVSDLTYRNFDTESLSSLFPFDECEIFSEKGIIKGKNLKTNSIIIVDHDELLNRNEVVIATSGGGKSTYLFGDMIRRWMQGTTIRVICPKGEFGDKAKQLGGEWVKVSPLNGNIINPFEIMHSLIPIDDNGEQAASSLLHQKISRLKTMFTLIYKDLKNKQVELSLLEKLLVELYADYGIHWETDFSSVPSTGFPCMEDLYRKIEHKMETDEQFKLLNGLYQVLYPYVEGSYAKCFNGHTNVDLSNDFIVFDISDLRDESDLQQVAMFNILTFMQDDALRDKTTITQIYVDEAHVLADPRNPLAMKFLSNMYKLIRSFQGGVTSATQQVGDFLSAVEGTRNYGEAVILNSISKLYLPMLREELNSIMEKTSENFSEEEQRLLIVNEEEKGKSAGRGVYVVGSKKVNIYVELTPEELRIWDKKWYERKFGKRGEQ